MLPFCIQLGRLGTVGVLIRLDRVSCLQRCVAAVSFRQQRLHILDIVHESELHPSTVPDCCAFTTRVSRRFRKICFAGSGRGQIRIRRPDCCSILNRRYRRQIEPGTEPGFSFDCRVLPPAEPRGPASPNRHLGGEYPPPWLRSPRRQLCSAAPLMQSRMQSVALPLRWEGVAAPHLDTTTGGVRRA